MDLYSYINSYSQNKTSLEIPRLVFHQAHLVKNFTSVLCGLIILWLMMFKLF